jgi:CRISPR-associated protein Cmr6
MSSNYEDVPLMYRSQIEGRCQIQRLPHAKKDAYQWVDEWIEGVEEATPVFGSNVQTKEYRITWRFVTNSGQDDKMIRPVIGAKGFPFYPGSSMKGTFLRVCTEEDALKYCGSDQENGRPGCLRFHGAYPKDLQWIDQELVDVVHPQQPWQVQGSSESHSAFVQISLYQPTLVFGISSTKPLSEEEWTQIWKIWEKALSKGIGSRVSAGYGQPKSHVDNCLFSIYLKGHGLAAKLINEEGEFRPNLFKATLRGHTLRLLGGVTKSEIAEQLTKELWGGFDDKKGAIVGELGIAFQNLEDLGVYNFTYTPISKPVDIPIFDLSKGKLSLLMMRDLSEKRQANLKIFLHNLIQFALLLGGFGKSWRRVNHLLFYPTYFNNNNKPMIGCHWELIGNSQKICALFKESKDIEIFLDKIYQNIQKFVILNKKEVSLDGCNWRESWHPDRVSVYSLVTNQSMAIKLFHDPNFKTTEAIGGRKPHREHPDKINPPTAVSCVWHRMLPIGDDKYLEIVTVFHGDYGKNNDPWKREGLDQLKPFIKALKDRGLVFTWGKNL